MSRQCEICKKRVETGYQYTYRGLAKYKGGVGRKVTGKTKRKFRPNLQRVRAVVDGAIRRLRVCTRCMKSGLVRKPQKRSAFDAFAAAKAAPVPPAAATEA
ncbi:MAG: 50S ribosomal protein L28 [Planctomycetes bacterium]|nr:50S ribosomal protein L28 [Planctomycetota bacterium]